ncbi:MAG: hypothetical protein NTV00_02775 [Methylococcales bacterium]|nr:hypothetical protein [Methylococcales bacterium]
MMSRYMKVGAALVGLVLIVSCKEIDKKPLTTEEHVKARVSERWQALIAGKLETAYGYEVPEYRKLFDVQKYQQGIAGVGVWTKAEVKDVACKEKCVVTVQVYATIHAARWGDAVNTSSLLKEQWTRDASSGEWFHLSSE